MRMKRLKNQEEKEQLWREAAVIYLGETKRRPEKCGTPQQLYSYGVLRVKYEV